MAARRSKTDAPQFSTVKEAPKPDKERKDLHNEDAPGYKPRKEESDEDPNAQERGTDHVFTVASRARWGNDDIADLNAESREIESRLAGNEPKDVATKDDGEKKGKADKAAK